MKIHILTVPATEFEERHDNLLFSEEARRDVEIFLHQLSPNRCLGSYPSQSANRVPELLKGVLESEKAGADAVIIDHMEDPGLEAAREIVSIPVIGAAQTAFTLASILTDKFSVISAQNSNFYSIETLIRRYALREKFASIRSIDFAPPNLNGDFSSFVAAVIKQCVRAIEKDGANGIVLGFTGLHHEVEEIKFGLREIGYDLPIINPSVSALKWAEMLSDLKLSQSLLTYPNGKSLLLPEHLHINGSPTQALRGTYENQAKIHVMVPVVQGYRPDNWLDDTLRDYTSYALPTSIVTASAITKGPTTIETHYLKSMAIPEMLRIANEAELQGATALIIDCMSDPSLDPVRQEISIPVIGPTQTCCFVAASLAHRFSILGTRSDMGHKFVTQVSEYGISSKMASVRTTGLSVEEVETNPNQLLNALTESGEKAVKIDGAHILIPGCTGMIGLAKNIQNALEELGYSVPVLEPPAVAIKMAELLTSLRLTHSKLTYRGPARNRD